MLKKNCTKNQIVIKLSTNLVIKIKLNLQTKVKILNFFFDKFRSKCSTTLHLSCNPTKNIALIKVPPEFFFPATPQARS